MISYNLGCCSGLGLPYCPLSLHASFIICCCTPLTMIHCSKPFFLWSACQYVFYLMLYVLLKLPIDLCLKMLCSFSSRSTQTRYHTLTQWICWTSYLCCPERTFSFKYSNSESWSVCGESGTYLRHLVK